MQQEIRFKLSICIITYNHIDFIESTLQSVLGQNIICSHEIIVADDCSTDGTKEVLLKYADKYDQISLILQDKNVGPSKNFTDLIVSATGEYVAYLDGDDLMLPGKVKFQMDFLDNNPECNIVAHNMYLHDFHQNKRLGVFSNFKSGKYTVGDLSSYGTFFSNSSKMYRNLSNKDYPYYDTFKYVGDLAWHIYQAKENPIGYTSQCFGIYRKHQNNSSTKNGSIQRIQKAYEENLASIKLVLNYGASEKELTRGIIRITYSLALQYLALNDYKSYKKYMRESITMGQFYSAKHFFLAKTLFLPNFLLRLI